MTREPTSEVHPLKIVSSSQPSVAPPVSRTLRMESYAVLVSGQTLAVRVPAPGAVHANTCEQRHQDCSCRPAVLAVISCSCCCWGCYCSNAMHSRQHALSGEVEISAQPGV